MAARHRFSVATDVAVYFCDPRSPWQRGTNEYANGLLREYFPPVMDLSMLTQCQLNAVARKLNTRPRKTLGWKTPAAMLPRSCCFDRLNPPALRFAVNTAMQSTRDWWAVWLTPMAEVLPVPTHRLGAGAARVSAYERDAGAKRWHYVTPVFAGASSVMVKRGPIMVEWWPRGWVARDVTIWVR